MQIFDNYSIATILERYDQGMRDEETCYLFEQIQQYKRESEETIEFYYAQFWQCCSDANVKDFMVWVEKNVPENIKGCLRNKYKGIPYDVLKRNIQSYKTISQIGIEVVPRPETEPHNYMEQWKDIAERMKMLQVSVFETHAHYNLENFNGFRNELMEHMHDAGIEKCIIPSIEAYKGGRSINQDIIRQYEAYDWIYYAFALHPKYLWKDSEWDERRWSEFEAFLRHPKCIAVGETGLDYSYPTFNEEHQKLQKEFFVRFIELANKHELPVILHLRSGNEHRDWYYNPDVNEDAWHILIEHPIKFGAVCHCFSGNINVMQKYLEAGVKYFGIGGLLLSGIEGFEEAVKEMSLESILLETDAPYINTLQGYHGPNTSFSLLPIAEKIAEIKAIDVRDILCITRDNANRLFHL